MTNKRTESAEEFIARKEKIFAQKRSIFTRDIARKGHHIWHREAWTFMQQSTYPEKVFVIERLRKVINGEILSSTSEEKRQAEYRIGYYIISKYGRTEGSWVWGQFCPLIPQEDLEPLLDKARREGTLL